MPRPRWPAYGLVNSCRHRGNRVCRVDRGNARSFVCSYHGWAYNTKGNLIGVPGKTELYKDDIDQPSLGLVRVARIDSHKGLVFGTFDPEAPSLEEFLGDMRWGWTCCWTRAIWSRRRAWCAGTSRATGSSPPTTRSAICTTPPGLIARPCWRGIWAATAPSRWRSMRRRASRRASPCWRPMGMGSTPTSPRPMRWTWARRWRPGGSIPPSRRGSGRCVPVQRSNMNVFPNLFVNSGSRDLMVRHPRGPEGWRFARRSWSIAMRRKRRGACRSVPPTGISAPPDVRAG